MNDRDRLAADLCPLTCVGVDERHNGISPAGRFCTIYADRLIALGWTRPREPGVYPTGHGIDVVVDVPESASWVEDEFPDEVAHLIAHAPLDEERLARALAKVIDDGWHYRDLYKSRPHEDAAAIAKAYREDTE